MKIDDEIKQIQPKMNELTEAKQKNAQEIKSTIASRLIALGFYEDEGYGDYHYAKSIDDDDRYSFWFCIDDCYAWGIADEFSYDYLIESDDFDTFEECYDDYLRNKDSWVFKKVTLSYTTTIFTNTKNDSWKEDIWDKMQEADESELVYCLQED